VSDDEHYIENLADTLIEISLKIPEFCTSTKPAPFGKAYLVVAGMRLQI
jgi:hypothetical protein